MDGSLSAALTSSSDGDATSSCALSTAICCLLYTPATRLLFHSPNTAQLCLSFPPPPPHPLPNLLLRSLGTKYMGFSFNSGKVPQTQINITGETFCFPFLICLEFSSKQKQTVTDRRSQLILFSTFFQFSAAGPRLAFIQSFFHSLTPPDRTLRTTDSGRNETRKQWGRVREKEAQLQKQRTRTGPRNKPKRNDLLSLSLSDECGARESVSATL